jgi:hypothetical protein
MAGSKMAAMMSAVAAAVDDPAVAVRNEAEVVAIDGHLAVMARDAGLRRHRPVDTTIHASTVNTVSAERKIGVGHAVMSRLLLLFCMSGFCLSRRPFRDLCVR